ncbi:S9 family peptidase, partial [Pseudoalteromonas sp. Angola-31]|nr:S9 family peptidase [Pseudoalteromonas sp. Angola-31]
MKTLLAMSLILGSSQLAVANTDTLQLQDIFNLEYANQIDITEDGKTVYFVRNRMDIKTDRKVGNIWSVDYSTGQLQPLTSGVYM